MSSWYSAAKPEAFIGIPRDSVDDVIGLDEMLARLVSLESISDALDAHTILEPLHVDLKDAGYTATTTRRILVLDPAAIQIDGGLNEVPRATCVLAVGRDAQALVGGATDRTATAITHILERYLSEYIPAKIYCRMRQTAKVGFPAGEGDAQEWVDEWVVLFDGFTTGPTRRGTPSDYKFVLHLAHFTANLTFSSSLSPSIAAGSEFPAAFSTMLYTGARTAGFGSQTPYGLCAQSLAGGIGLYADFWGYYVPKADGTPFQFETHGLKGFLLNLANQNLFDGQKLKTSDLGASRCNFEANDITPKNNKAISALDKIEPFWNNGVKNKPPAPLAVLGFAKLWGEIRDAIRKKREANLAAGSTKAVSRADLIKDVPEYANLGYQYGLPIGFYLNEAILGGFGVHTGFASDVASASFEQLAPASFWELLIQRYGTNFQIALAPMANRAVVIPFQPLLDGAWQTIYASEMDSWDDDIQTPVPVRGVVLVSNRRSDAGFGSAGVDPSQPQASYGAATGDAAYDSCTAGVFIYRAMPQWLVQAYRCPAKYYPNNWMGGMRASVYGAAASVVNAAAAAAAGIPDDPDNVIQADPTAPSETKRSTANRMALALYQQERARPRTVYVSGRFRYDIGPGSVVSLDLPADRYVKAALLESRDTRMTGMVTRVTLTLDQESKTASTSFQIGFVRTEGETKKGAPLFADSHPFWATSGYGLPWADAAWIRARLANRADINYA